MLRVLEVQRTFNEAVQEENRRLAIPKYYEINGRIACRTEQLIEQEEAASKVLASVAVHR